MAGQIIPRGKNVWLLRIYRGRDESGKRAYQNKTVRGSKKQAQAELNKLLHARDTGTLVRDTRETFGAYLTRWLEGTVKPRVRPQTFRDYEYRVNRYIRPELGTLRLSAVAPEALQSLYAGMLERKLTPRSVRYAHALLHSALEQAAKWRLITHNPAKLVDLPRQSRREQRVLDPAQAALFLEKARADKWYPLWCVLIYGGLRPSEALALRWQDLDGGKLRVQRVLVREKGGGWRLDEPKTSRSRRTVTLPAPVVDALKEHRKSQAAARLKAGDAWQDNGFIFAGEAGEPLFISNLTQRHFAKIREAAGLPHVRLYDLRHTSATLLLAAGEHPKVVSERLGHSSVVLTLDTYSHVLPDMQHAAAEKLAALLSHPQTA